jgi:hypothetical protein
MLCFGGRNTFFMKWNVYHLFIYLLCSIIFISCSKNKPYENYNGENAYFQLINGKYFSERRNENNLIQAIGDAPHEWETFYIEKKGTDTINIKTKDGFYLSYNNNDSVLIASATTATQTEAFIIEPYKEYYQLKTIFGKNVVLAENSTLKIANNGKLLIFKFIPQSNLPKSIIHLNQINFLRFFLQLFVFLLVIFLIFKFVIKKSVKNVVSWYIFFIIGFSWGYTIVHNENWKFNNVITNDSIIYYEYLPATFIFNDVSFYFVDNLPSDFNGSIWVNDKKTYGNRAPKFTFGLSLIYLPFFLVGHLMANILGYSTYGYSLPYFVLICLSSWFYAILGIYYIRKILLLYFNDIVVGFTMLSIALATNLFHYVVQDTAMTHAYSFFLFTLFIWFIIKWHEQKQLKTSLFIGVLIGLITLIRPTNAILAVVFILYDVSSFTKFKERIKLFWEYRNQIFIIVVCALLIWIPQFIHWKYLTDHWFYFSYKEEGFFFSNPHILDGLFSYRKGWLVYTPIMIFSILGILFLYKEQKKWVMPITVFLILNIYIVYSWWCWWYGGGYGSRPMIESYALMAIPLASFFAFFDKKTSYLRSVSLFVMFILISLNLFQTLQMKSCLHYDSMTKEAFWSNFTLTGWPENYEKMISPPDYEKALNGEK